MQVKARAGRCSAVIKIKRVYETPTKEDGYRILVDRVWPRGLSKERVAVALWLKEVAPSTDLRKWFSHETEKWAEFKKSYKAELKKKRALIDKIRQAEEKEGTVTLVFAAKDERFNDAVVLLAVLQGSNKTD
jgi:uncharacterized protein YeaO (DUF488 family)